MKGKRLYRSKTDRVIVGVCGGLGEHFGIDSIIFRILFIFISPLFLVYFVMWIFVPEDPNQKGVAKGSSFLKILLIILFFLIPFIFILFFYSFFTKFFTSPSEQTSLEQIYPNTSSMSAVDLAKDAASRWQEAVRLQNKDNLTSFETQRIPVLIDFALSGYRLAAKKDSKNTDALQGLAVINQKLGDALGNSQSSEQTKFYNDSAWAYYDLGQVYLQKGLKDQARQALQQALKIVPSSNELLREYIQKTLKVI